MRAEMQKRFERVEAARVKPQPEPRYDDVFYEGLAVLNRMASGEDDDE
jgi:hypothetical protein